MTTDKYYKLFEIADVEKIVVDGKEYISKEGLSRRIDMLRWVVDHKDTYEKTDDLIAYFQDCCTTD